MFGLRERWDRPPPASGPKITSQGPLLVPRNCVPVIRYGALAVLREVGPIGLGPLVVLTGTPRDHFDDQAGPGIRAGQWLCRAKWDHWDHLFGNTCS